MDKLWVAGRICDRIVQGIWRIQGITSRYLKFKVSLVRQPHALKKAKSIFLAGQPSTALQLLNSLEHEDGRGLVLASRIALFASEFEKAEQLANQASWLLATWSRDARQAFYLRQEAMRKLGRHQQARALFNAVPFEKTSNRFYQALRLAVIRKEDLSFYEAHCLGLPLYSASWRRASANYLLLLRNLGKTDQAIELAKIRKRQLTSHFKFGQLRARQKPSAQAKGKWVANAAQALQDLDRHLREHEVEVFLISGTLLGCVREGTILAHDKDVDVGVSEKHTKEDLQRLIRKCPVLKEKEIDSTKAVYVEHVNGVSIDIFIHYKKDATTIAHGGLKAEWVNTRFEVGQAEFLGHRYGIPVDTDLYLKENYGEWRIPKRNFETFADTPNMLVTNTDNFELCKVMATTDYYLTGNSYGLNRLHSAK